MNKLKEIRKRLGVSKWRLSRDSGLNWKTIHRIETEDKGPFESSKEKIARALGTTVEEIFPSGDVAHIFVIEPRKFSLEKKKTLNSNGEIIGYLLDEKLRRCAGVNVHLYSGRTKIATTASEEDGRFMFKNLMPDEYTIQTRKTRQDVLV